MTVERHDKATLGKAVRTDAGFLTAPAFLSRVGVFTYKNGDGSVRREFRPPEEVFHEDSLASFAMVPLTLDHPGEMLTSATAKKHAVGSVGEEVREDGDKVSSRVRIIDDEAISAVERGANQLSCGYRCDIEDKPGTYKGEAYDVIQRNIRGNHVAIVSHGRAGPDVRLRLDSADAIQIDARERPDQPKGDPVKTQSIRIDGISFDLPESAAQAVAKVTAELEAVRADSANLRKSLDEATGKLDAATAALEAEKTARADAQSPERVAELVAARVGLERTAAKVLGGEAKFDGKTDDDIRKAVIEKVTPGVKLEDRSSEYVAARFDAAVDFLAEKSVDETGVIVTNASRDDAADPRAEMIANNAKRGLRVA